MRQQLTAKQQFWSEILESADNSDLSLVEFTKANQLDPQSLYRWRNHLKKSTIETTESVTQFSQIVATSYSAMPSMPIQFPNGQLQPAVARRTNRSRNQLDKNGADGSGTVTGFTFKLLRVT